MRSYLLPFLLIAIAVGLIIQTACAPIYVPPKVQAPLLSNAGEVHAAASMDLARHGFDAQAAWSPYNHFGLYGDFSIATHDSSLPNTETHLRHAYGEGAIGWYTRIDDGTRVELLGGMGFGTTATIWYPQQPTLFLYGPPNLQTDTQLYVARGTYLRYFVQGNWGTTRSVPDTVNTLSESGFALRAGWLQFIHLSDSTGNDAPRGTVFFEPAMFIRAGSRTVQIEVMGGSSLIFSQYRYDGSTIFLQFGIHIMFGRGM
ncbi:MAG: hypothetical protein ABIR47_06000 [Candidatus Kapaibacterium sp.]